MHMLRRLDGWFGEGFLGGMLMVWARVRMGGLTVMDDGGGGGGVVGDKMGDIAQ